VYKDFQTSVRTLQCTRIPDAPEVIKNVKDDNGSKMYLCVCSDVPTDTQEF
jgi:hypothetical protein